MSREAMKLALEALERTLEMLEQADCSTGYCCCGSLIDGHGIGDGHGPVDGGDYYQSKAIQAARHAITALREALAEQPSRPYRPLQDNGSKYFGAWDKADQALNRMADNARELGLDYEPDGMHHNKPQKRPQNCGTGYCSCIECVMEPAQRTWVGLTELEKAEITSLKWWDWEDTFDIEGFIRAIEAKLKEKNT